MFRAGAAKVDITPGVGCWLEGIPRAQPSDAIHDPLHARALVVEPADGNSLCLVSCDLIALGREYTDQVRQRIAQALGTAPDHVVVACTHNHSGPATLGLFHDPEHVDRDYLDQLASKLVQVCRSAAEQVQPALLGVGRGEETTVSEYRRLLARDGRIVMNWEEFPQQEIVGPAEQGDPEMGVVKIVARGDLPGPQTIAIVFNYACHPNSMPGDNFTITADFPGYAADVVEKRLGGIALFTNAAQGSVDIEGFEGRDFQGVARRGQALAEAVTKICGGIEAGPDPVIRAARQVFRLPTRSVDPHSLAWAQEITRKMTGETVTLRDGISDEIMALNILQHANSSEPGIDFEMLGIRLGRSVFVTIPGELFTEIGRKMKALSPSLQLHVIGLANGYHGYIPTARASLEGGYATDVASGAYLAENAEDLICQSTQALLTSLH